MQERLVGREQEFGMVAVPGLKKLPVDDGIPGNAAYASLPEYPITHGSPDERLRFSRARKIIDMVCSLGCPSLTLNESNSDTWLANGSRIYIDRGSLLETASPECRVGSLDVIRYEKASERMLNLAIKMLIDSGEFKELSLYKNNTAPSGTEEIFPEVTYGHHQNYMFGSGKSGRVSRILKTFIPTSLILSGSGHVYRDENKNWRYIISPRATHIKTEETGNTIENRPLINSREQPERMHLISRDATRCEFQTWLVDMTTHLVMRLAEEGWEMPINFPLQDPIGCLKSSNNSFGDFLNSSDSGWKISYGVDVLDYNRVFLDAAKQLEPLSEDENDAIEEWERILEILSKKAIEKLVGEIDWATKWHLLTNQMKKHGYGLDDLRAWKIDAAYHNISDDPNQSWFARLDNFGYIKHLLDSEDIRHGMENPPIDTRAFSRGKFIRLVSKNPKMREGILDIDWAKVKFGVRGSDGAMNWKEYSFGEKGNPFAPISSDLEKMYADKYGIKSE